MSNPPNKSADKVRTRGRAASLPGTVSPPRGGGKQQQLPTGQPPTGQPPMKPMEDTKLDLILSRLIGVEAGMTTLTDQHSVFKKQYEGDTSVNRLASDTFNKQHAAGIKCLTGLLENERQEKVLAKRELLITQRNLAAAIETNSRLEIRLNTLENSQRICNVRIDGRPEEDNEDLRAFVSEIGHKIGLKNMSPTDIITVRRMGKHPRPGARQRPRTIMITFANVEARNTFFYSRSNLRNVPEFRGVYLNDDVTPLTHKMRDDYRSVACLARNAGEEVRVHSDGIVIGGTKYLLTEPQSLPARFSLRRAKTLEVNDELYFHSEHSYLSNFAPSPIVEDGVVYDTAEHLYQAAKCKHAKQMECHGRVLVATSPREAKRLADAVPESPEWRAVRDEVMVRVIDAKFDQNPGLADMLLNTGDRPLNEATTNMHFGIGVGLHANEIRDKGYRGANKLGLALVAKRSSIRAAINIQTQSLAPPAQPPAPTQPLAPTVHTPDAGPMSTQVQPPPQTQPQADPALPATRLQAAD